jgi:hypothetical protein
VSVKVHHRTIQINHQPDATVFQFIILTFIYSSTCFGRFPAHHQKLNDCSDSLWFYLPIVVIAVPDHDQKHCYHYAPKIKPEAATPAIASFIVREEHSVLKFGMGGGV